VPSVLTAVLGAVVVDVVELQHRFVGLSAANARMPVGVERLASELLLVSLGTFLPARST
jgi:hypothetical protein